VEVVALTASDQRLLAARYAEHENSHRRMADALRDAGAADAAARLDALRRIEHHFDLDLGLICHRFARRHAPDTHPLERAVIEYLAEVRCDEAGRELLWVIPGRARQLDDLMHGRLVGERD
jgi:hypothetical protein